MEIGAGRERNKDGTMNINVKKEQEQGDIGRKTKENRKKGIRIGIRLAIIM